VKITLRRGRNGIVTPDAASVVASSFVMFVSSQRCWENGRGVVGCGGGRLALPLRGAAVKYSALFFVRRSLIWLAAVVPTLRRGCYRLLAVYRRTSSLCRFFAGDHVERRPSRGLINQEMGRRTAIEGFPRP